MMKWAAGLVDGDRISYKAWMRLVEKRLEC